MSMFSCSFSLLGSRTLLRFLHGQVTLIPPGFTSIAYTSNTEYAAVEDQASLHGKRMKKAKMQRGETLLRCAVPPRGDPHS